jgi:DUF971 family protein
VTTLWDHMKPAARIPAPVGLERLEGGLHIRWDDGVQTDVSARELRLGCPCAACVEEWSGRRMVEADQIPGDIGIASVEPVGNYAASIGFTDGHATGIYSWKTLRSLGKVV